MPISKNSLEPFLRIYTIRGQLKPKPIGTLIGYRDTLPENRKVGSIYHMFVSCFLIETKFISKLFKKSRRRNESQETPRLRLFTFSWKINTCKRSLKINKMKIKITGNVCKSMRVGKLGLGTYPSQIFRLLLLFSTWEYKNRSHGGKSILLVARCRDSNRNRRIMTFIIVDKSRNDGKSIFWYLRWWLIFD